MSVLLERLARRLAGEQPHSRREMLMGRGGPSPMELADRRPTPVPDGNRKKPTAPLPKASPAETHVMRSALDRASPTRDELLTLIEALRDPTSAGTFSASANKAIGGLRSELASAHREVAAISTPSALRINVLAFLADVDAVMANLQAVGRSTDPARAARLRTTAHLLQTRVNLLEQEIGPALAIHRSKSGRG